MVFAAMATTGPPMTEAVAGDVNTHEALEGTAQPCDEGGGTPVPSGGGASEERALLVQRRESE